MICPLPYAPTLALTFGAYKEDTRRTTRDGTPTGYVAWTSLVRDGRWDAKWSTDSATFLLTFTPDVGRSRSVRVRTDARPLHLHPKADPANVLRLAQEVVAAAWSGR